MKFFTNPGYIIIAILSVWIYSMYSDNVIPSQNIETRLKETKIPIGQNIEQLIKVDRVRICPIKVERILVDADSTRYILHDVNVRVPGKLGHDEYSQEIYVPKGIEKGPAKLYIRSFWSCNPLQHIFPLKGKLNEFDLEFV